MVRLATLVVALSLALPAAASAAIHGPGPIRTLGTAVAFSDFPVVVTDARRYFAFPATDGRHVRFYDALRRRRFSVRSSCAHPLAAARPGVVLALCTDDDRDAVVIDAVTHRVHRLRAKPYDADAGESLEWRDVGRRYAAYAIERECDSVECYYDNYLVNWHTGQTRSVPERECRRNLDVVHPHPACLPTALPKDHRLHDGEHYSDVGPKELWLLDLRRHDRKRLSRDCWNVCSPVLAAGWATWVEPHGRFADLQARSVPGGRRRTWRFGGQWAPEPFRAGRTLVAALRAGPGRRRVVLLPRLSAAR